MTKKREDKQNRKKKGIHTTGYKTQYSLCNIFDHSQEGFECVPGLCPEASVALLQPTRFQSNHFFLISKLLTKNFAIISQVLICCRVTLQLPNWQWQASTGGVKEVEFFQRRYLVMKCIEH